MIGGPIRDFNVIFDGSRLAASVRPVDGALPDCPAGPGRLYALLALTAGVALDGQDLPAGGLALSEHFAAQFSADFRGLLVTFEQTR